MLNGDDHTDLDWLLIDNKEKSNEMILNAQNLLETIWIFILCIFH